MQINTLGLKIKSSFLLLCLSISSACNLLESSETPTQTTTETISPTEIVPIEATATEEFISGTITIWHSWEEWEMPALVQVISNFQNLYPDVYFDVLYIPPEDLKARYETVSADGSGPNILLGPADWGPLFYDAGYIINLSSLVNDSLINSINKAALGAVEYEDSIIGLPHSMEGIVLFRNNKILTEQAITFNDLVEDSILATQGETVGAYLEQSFLYSGAHLNGMGGDFLNSEKLPAFNNKNGELWIELVKDLNRAGPTDYFSDKDIQLFMEGKVGAVIDGTWNMRQMGESIGFDNLEIDPWPAYNDGYLSGYVLPEIAYISSQTTDDRKTATIKFIEYLLTPEAQSLFADVGHIPTISGVNLNDPVYGALISQAITALAGGSPYPVVPEFDVYLIPIDIALKQALFDGIPAVQVLQTAEDSIINSLYQVSITPTPIP